MMHKKISFFFSALLICAFLIGCSSTAVEPAVVEAEEDVSTQISIVDGLGREVTLESPATRIVSLSPSNTELLYAVGAGEQVVGRDAFSDYPEEASSLPDIGGGYSEYNLEQIINLEPDLVLAAEINTAELVQSIADLGIPVFYISNPVSFNDLYTTIENVGLLTGHADTAQLVITDAQERVEAVVTAIAEADTAPVVFYELDATDPSKPYTAGPNTFYSTLISMAGGKNVGDALSASWAQISLEELVIQDPDIILLGDSLWGITTESVGEREGWNGLTAVKEGNVFPFDDNLLARPGPPLVDGLEALAQVLHPEGFK
jgi:iron complex transport system substrate-binding protein